MTLTFTSPEWVTKTTNLWKKHKAPCFLRQTDDPCVCSVSVRHGVPSIVAQLFLVNTSFAPECHKIAKKLLLHKYTSEEKNQILEEVAKYDVIIEKTKKLWNSNK